MRCKACDKMMSDYEATRKDKLTGDFLDLCGQCNQASTQAYSDFESTVDIAVDFGTEDVYDLKSRYRVAYDEE